MTFIEASLEELPVSADLGQSCLATKISAPGPSNFGWFRHTDRRSKEFMDGVHEFIEAAEKHKYGCFVRCPCKFYKNEKDYS